MSDARYITIVVGHEPVRYYKAKRPTRSYRLNLLISDNPTIADSFGQEVQEAKAREFCKTRIARHRSGEEPIRYIHVTWHDGYVHQWSPAKKWITK